VFGETGDLVAAPRGPSASLKEAANG